MPCTTSPPYASCLDPTCAFPQGFINTIIPLLHLRLQARQDEIWQEARAVRGHSSRAAAARRMSFGDAAASTPRLPSLDGSARGRPTQLVAEQLLGREGSGCSSSPLLVLGGCASDAGSDSSSDWHSGEQTPTSLLADVKSKRLCTQAMIKVQR
jgi:hypothetical protein